MRIVSDFDGVWTDQAGEAEAIRAGFARDAAALMGVPAARARTEFDGFLARTHAEPHLHGWWPRGHLTAFLDEDELLATGAVSVWLDRATDDAVATRWLDALRAAGHETAEDFANQQFGPAMRAHRRTGQHRLVPEARAVLDAVHAGGGFRDWERAFAALPEDRPRRAIVRPSDRIDRRQTQRAKAKAALPVVA